MGTEEVPIRDRVKKRLDMPVEERLARVESAITVLRVGGGLGGLILIFLFVLLSMADRRLTGRLDAEGAPPEPTPTAIPAAS